MENISMMVEIFHKGGFVMYILLLLSIAIVAVAIDRYLYFKHNDAGQKFTEKFCKLLEQKEYDQAFSYAAQTAGSIPDVITRSLDGYLVDRNTLSSYLEIQSGIVLSHFNAKLYFLSVVVTMGPLLGLLGTITGMIAAFSVLNTSAGAMAITGGVGEALIATASGIFVALVALVIHSYFKQRIESIINDMERAFSELEAKRGEILKVGGMTDEVA